MNPISLLSGVALLGIVALGMQGVDKITGGELYLASVANLAQETTNSLPPAEPVAPIQPAIPAIDTSIMIQQSPMIEPGVIAPMPINMQGQPIDQGQMEKQPIDDGRQNQIMDERDMMIGEDNGQNYIDPREVQQVTRDLKQLNTEIKRVRTQLKRLKATAADTEELNAIASEVAKIQAVVTNKSAGDDELWEAVDEFRNGYYWDRMNKIRAKVEIPDQAKQINTTLKRLEKSVNTKAMQNLGFDITKVRAVVGEMKQNLAAVQATLAAGNLDDAMEAMQFFYEGGHPGEVESTLFRMRDIRNMLKQVRDKDILAQVEEILQEVIVSFNEGNYRDARETMDEYYDDLQALVKKVAKAKISGTLKTESVSKLNNLEALVKTKLDERETVREQKSIQTNRR